MNLLTLLLQTTDTLVTPPVLTPTVETAGDLNLWELACKGGIIMIPLCCSPCYPSTFFRKAASHQTSRTRRQYVYGTDQRLYPRRRHRQRIETLQKTNTPYSRLIAKGISRLGRPMNDVLVAIENVGNIEIAKLEKGFPWLATTAAGAPMLGFLGTVTGMVRAFYNMASAGNNADISTLSGGIYEALVTTVAGLIVGIIALFAYNYLVSRVDGVMNQLEAKTMEFMDLLNEPAE